MDPAYSVALAGIALVSLFVQGSFKIMGVLAQRRNGKASIRTPTTVADTSGTHGRMLLVSDLPPDFIQRFNEVWEVTKYQSSKALKDQAVALTTIATAHTAIATAHTAQTELLRQIASDQRAIETNLRSIK